MKRFTEVLLEIWREVCRHIEIDEAVARIAPLISGRLPLDQLRVLEIEPESGSPVLVAAAGPDGAAPSPWPQVDLDKAAADRLAAWIGQGKLVRGSSADLAEQLGWVGGNPAGGGVAAVPLKGHDITGAAVLQAHPGHTFTDEHEALLSAVLEPLSVAMENDHRLRELQRLRQAAEADKASLLRRIGRQDLAREPIVGSDSGLATVMGRVELVSRSDVPVLILGETGSGKEVIARAIHKGSARREGPFMRVNCGAISPELIDSELFGHEKGAFTGATGRRQGWFEQSDGGTLLLDEIGELPLAAQVRLLRVLQDGTFQRVGGEEPIRVDVRIIAATHRDLAAMVQDGDFRQDLWYRIAVFPVLLPPLRERVEDIPALADHFARRAATRFGLRYCAPSAADLGLLKDYAWPGNVRELASVIDRAAILGDGSYLDITRALGTAQFPGPADITQGANMPVHPGRPEASVDARSILTMEQAMARHIQTALQASGGRVEGAGGAADLLDINPSTLRSRMRKLGLGRK